MDPPQPPPTGNHGTAVGNLQENSATRSWSPQARSTSPTPIELINPRKFLISEGTSAQPSTPLSLSGSSSSSTYDQFELVAAGGERPRECYGHTSVLLGDTMYLFGGFDGTQFSDTLFAFSLETREWRAVRSSSPRLPKGRHFHAAAVLGGAMYIWGGKSNGYMNDLWRFEPAGANGTWTELPQDGPLPSKRYGHSCVVHGSALLLFGGYDDFGFPCNDLHQLELGRGPPRWSPLRPTAGARVPERFHHSAVLHHGSMYVFGGYGAAAELLLEYRLGSGQWAVLPLAGAPPSARWGHRAVCVRDRMLVLGGCDQIVNYSDMYAYSFAAGVWTRLPTRGYPQRFFHALVATRAGELLACGGKNMHNYLFNDLHLCRTTRGAAAALERPDTLASDMRGLLSNARYSGDVVFVVRGGEEVRAHRLVLLARCPCLEKKVRKRGRPTEPPAPPALRVRLKRVTGLVLSAVLEYLYTGTCPLQGPPASPRPVAEPVVLSGSRTTSPTRASSPPRSISPGSGSPPSSPGPLLQLSDGLLPDSEWPAELLRAAAWLELDHLMSLCEARLAARMASEEVVTLLLLAEELNAPDLRHTCQQRIAASAELLEAARHKVPRTLHLELKRLARPPPAPPAAP